MTELEGLDRIFLQLISEVSRPKAAAMVEKTSPLARSGSWTETSGLPTCWMKSGTELERSNNSKV